MEGAPAADVEFFGRHLGPILHRRIGELEESAAESGGSLRSIRHMPDLHARQTIKAVIRRAVQLDHLQPLLDKVDERHEQLAIEPVLVEVTRWPVGRGDHRHTLVQQRREQPREDHGVGRVVDHHLVEAEQPRLGGDALRDRWDRIAPALLADAADALVHVEHEGMEVDAALRFGGDVVEGEVHQHGLAAPHPAPQVDAAHGLRIAPQQLAQQPAASGGELARQAVKCFRRPPLVGVGTKLAGTQQLLIRIKDGRHAARLAAGQRPCQALD